MLKLIWTVICIAYDFLFPRFITEDVALEKTGPGHDWDAYDVAFPMREVLEGEVFDAVASADAITWLGIGVCYRIGNSRPWPRMA